MSYKSTPPLPGAGDTNPITIALRPAIPLTEDQIVRVRRLRRADPSLTDADIAALIGGTEEAVRLALTGLRTRVKKPSRATLNVSVEAAEYAKTQQRAGEALWRTIDRIFNR
jgi:transcriptional regulator